MERLLKITAPTFDRRANRRLWAAFVCGLVGIAGAFATIYASPVKKAPVLSCGVEMLACDVALTAPISRIVGIPLGVFGVFYFMFWTLNLREFHRTGQDEYQAALTWGTTLGAVVSISLATYMFGVLGAPCLYCLITHTANISAVVLIWPYRRWKAPDFTVNEVWHFAAISAVAVLAASTTYFANENRQARADLARLEQGEMTIVEAATTGGSAFSAIADLPDALAEASRNGRHLVVFVYHPLCGACRTFKERVYQTRVFEDFATTKLVQLVVNAAEADISEFKDVPVELSRRLDPRYYPTLALIAPDGDVVFLDEGMTDYVNSAPEKLVAALDSRMAAN